MDALLAELEVALTEISGRIERWQALLRIADGATTIAQLNDELTFMRVRLDLIQQSILHLSALRAQGYPNIRKRQLGAEECEDLKTDHDLIMRALAEDIVCQDIGATSVSASIGPERPVN